MVGARKSLREVLGPVRTKEIEEAALRVIAARGLEGATMQAIADEAGLAKGTLYLYFEGRDELLIHLAESAFEELLASVDAALSGTEPARTRMEAGIAAQFAFFESRRDFFRVFVEVVHPGGAASARRKRSCNPLYQSFVSRFARFFREAHANSELHAPLPERLALFVAEGVNGLILNRLSEPNPPLPDEEVRWIVDSVLNGIEIRRSSS